MPDVHILLNDLQDVIGHGWDLYVSGRAGHCYAVRRDHGIEAWVYALPDGRWRWQVTDMGRHIDGEAGVTAGRAVAEAEAALAERQRRLRAATYQSGVRHGQG